LKIAEKIDKSKNTFDALRENFTSKILKIAEKIDTSKNTFDALRENFTSKILKIAEKIDTSKNKKLKYKIHPKKHDEPKKFIIRKNSELIEKLID